MNILLIETIVSGHHSVYLENIAAAFLKSGHQVTVSILNSKLMHISLLRLKEGFGNSFDIFPVDDASYEAAFKTGFGEAGREIALRTLFGNIYKQVNKNKPIEYVFLPFVDYCLYALGMFGSPFGKTKWAGICMRPSFQYRHFSVVAPLPKLAKIKEWLFFKLLRNLTLTKLFTIDELLAKYVVEQRPAYASRVQYLPDPAELLGDHTYASARQALDIADSTKLVLVYGAIDERKGLDALVRATGHTAVPSHVHVLIVGKQTDWARKFLASDEMAQKLIFNKRLHVIEGFVNDEQQQMVFSACDVVWLGYRNHYTMSGVFILSRIAKKGVIATAEGLIGWLVKNEKNGLIVNVEIRDEIILSLNRDIDISLASEFKSDLHEWNHFSYLLSIN